MTNLAWTEMDTAILHLRYHDQVSPKLIARELCRTRAAVMVRATECKIATRCRPPRSETLPRGDVRLPEIAAIVRRHFGLAQGVITSKRRAIKFSRPRQIAMVMALEFTNLSYPQIGAFFHRDHTTIIHAKQRIGDLCRDWPEFAADVAAIRKRIAAVACWRVAGRMGEAAWAEFERAETM